jgi:glycosyltransferase involved in cell wall biosynthesis
MAAAGVRLVADELSFRWAASDVPMICTRTGGLDAYFDEGEVTWVPPSDPPALRAAIKRLKADPVARTAQATAARERLLQEDYSSRRFVLTHCHLTRELLGVRAEVGAPSATG